MSTDINAYFDRSERSLGPEALLEKLNGNPAEFTEVVARYRDHWTPKNWSIDQKTEDEVQMLGLGGFALRFHPSYVQMYHVMRFCDFASMPALRDPLRRACFYLASALGSPRAIFTHELMPCEGTSLAEIEANLREKVGPPAVDFEELAAAELYEARAWYIEKFKDLS